jgi:hypothetical protein
MRMVLLFHSEAAALTGDGVLAAVKIWNYKLIAMQHPTKARMK